MKKIKRTAAVLSAAVMGLSAAVQAAPMSADAATSYNVEFLDRGISAFNTGSGMIVSWRYLGSDAENTVFKLYRGTTLIYTSEAGKATCYLDKEGNASSAYRVDTVVDGKVVASDKCSIISDKNYFDIPMDVPKAGSDYTYSPNDCSTGDVDGDGVYEIFVKWDPSNSKDNSQSGVTGNVYIDCYRLNGQKLWRIDLGKNIRAGAHYTQFIVADFDLDGKAEMTCKTGDGTIDGKGKVIGDGSKDYRNSAGHILTGPEYYTLFDGATGAALDTVNYEFPRGEVSKKTWGDDYGNRCERYLGAAVYCDGVKPSAVSIRGYYTRMTAVAYDVVNKKLVKRWSYDTGYDASKPGYADGNHNCMPADVDGDGKQELFVGATCFDDNGKVLWCNEKGHGDAMHVGDLLPDRAGLEAWVCHEHEPYGVSLLDAKTGKDIFHYDHSKDTGRCAADNVYAGNPGAEFWGAASGDVYDGTGKATGIARGAQNFLIHWVGDLERELLDGNTITKINDNKKIDTIFTASGCSSNNSTKSTPNLTADLFGDWREELVLRTDDNKALRVFGTTYTTDYRITTLMHDPQYRMQVSAEQTSYNQPPHTSFYLGSDKPLPARVPVTVLPGSGGAPVITTKPGAVMDTSFKYVIKNANSGLYLTVTGENPKEGSDVVQSAESQAWTLADAGDGYYYIYSSAGDGKTYLLDLDYGKVENGTNIGIYTDTKSDAQLFKFVDNGDGTYTITTKVTDDASCIGVGAGSKAEGASVIEWESTGAVDQKWTVEISIDKLSGNLVKNLERLDVKNHAAWSVDNSFAAGSAVFGDRDFTYVSVPDKMIGAEYIRTAADSKYTETDLGVFKAGADITVYVSMDNRVDPLPEWLSSWTKTDMTAVSSNDVTFDLYAKEFKTGDTVTLGKNGQSAYCVNYAVFVAKTETAPQRVIGDVNADGMFSILDAVMMQKYLNGAGTLTDMAAGELTSDGRINIFDLAVMKSMLKK